MGNPHLREPLTNRAWERPHLRASRLGQCETMPRVGPCDCDNEEWESCPSSGRSFRATAMPEAQPMFVKTESLCAQAWLYIYISNCIHIHTCIYTCIHAYVLEWYEVVWHDLVGYGVALKIMNVMLLLMMTRFDVL